jgi:triose/dihydroxyacetone kinase / FAD-AMP lyase (cyclizing)
VYSTSEDIAGRLATIGVGLEHCHVCCFSISMGHNLTYYSQVPGTASSESHLGAKEIEIGMGIHNEPGARRVSPVPPLNELIPSLINNLTSTTDPDRSFVPFKGKGDRVVLLVNNLGGTSELEMGAIARQALKDLISREITVERVISGTFMV